MKHHELREVNESGRAIPAVLPRKGVRPVRAHYGIGEPGNPAGGDDKIKVPERARKSERTTLKSAIREVKEENDKGGTE